MKPLKGGNPFVTKLTIFCFISISYAFSFTAAHFHGMMRANPVVVGGGYSIINIFTYLFIYFIIKE